MKTFRQFLGSAIMVFGLVLLACVGSNTAYAEGLSLTMSPMKQKIVVNPGDSYVGSVTIFNPISNGKALQTKNALKHSPTVTKMSIFRRRSPIIISSIVLKNPKNT